MWTTDRVTRNVALVLTFTTVVATTPVSAAEVTGPPAVIGALSGTGNVQVRGVVLKDLKRETTLFTEDRVRTGAGASAKMSLSNGTRIEAGGDTDFVVSGAGEKGIRIILNSGAIGFTAGKAPVVVVVSGQELQATNGTRANVTMIPASTLANVTVHSGKVEAKNLNSKETAVIAKGAQVLNLKTGALSPAVPKFASLIPPAPAPAAPRAAAPMAAATSYMGLLIAAAAEAVGITVISRSSPNSTLTPSEVVTKNTAVAESSSLLASTNTALVASRVLVSASLDLMALNPGNSQIASISSSMAAEAADIQSIHDELPSLSAQLQATTDPVEVASLSARVNSARVRLIVAYANMQSLTDAVVAILSQVGVTSTPEIQAAISAAARGDVFEVPAPCASITLPNGTCTE